LPDWRSDDIVANPVFFPDINQTGSCQAFPRRGLVSAEQHVGDGKKGCKIVASIQRIPTMVQKVISIID
jgi:hypothetical protein